MGITLKNKNKKTDASKGISSPTDRTLTEGNATFAYEPEDVSSLRKGCYGISEKNLVFLFPEEALYLLDIRNGKCLDEEGNEIGIGDLAEMYKMDMTKYFTYRAWRDRGLIIRPIEEAIGAYGRSPIKKYPSGKLVKYEKKIKAHFFDNSLVSIIEDKEVGRELYEKYWLGQYGTYKADHKGIFCTFDVYESLLLMKHFDCDFGKFDEKKIIKAAKKRRSDFLSLYEVYEDWRLRGYVLKTGFKFGTHFRLYFPGAGPKLDEGDWMHSKHVIHVFPRDVKLLISEWSRAIRVAHSVRKTFILAIPGEETSEEIELDFLLFHRRKGNIETPNEGKPSFLMFSLNEEEYLGGNELALAISKAKKLGLDIMLAICDRETSVTFYRLKRIELPGSRYEYYEIEWAQP